MTANEPDPILATLTAMKKRLAWIAENGNRWPRDEGPVVKLSDVRNPRDDEWRKGQSDAFDALWPLFLELQAEAVRRGLIEREIELDSDETEAIPF